MNSAMQFSKNAVFKSQMRNVKNQKKQCYRFIVCIRKKYFHTHIFTVFVKALKFHFFSFIYVCSFTTSELHVFYLSPGEKKGFAFGKIEQSIVVLMRKFELFFRPISEKLSNLNEAQTQTAKSQEREALLETTSENLLDLIASEEYTALYFDFFFVSDELVFYGLKGYVGHFVFQLANLLHMFVLNHRVFHFALKRCGRDRKSPLFHFVTQWVNIFHHQHSFNNIIKFLPA